jgi:hypothetical protein
LIQQNYSVVNQRDLFQLNQEVMEYHGEQQLELVDFRMIIYIYDKIISSNVEFSSGFPPKLPTRAFHSSEESIYGAGDFQQQPLKENPIV